MRRKMRKLLTVTAALSVIAACSATAGATVRGSIGPAGLHLGSILDYSHVSGWSRGCVHTTNVWLRHAIVDPAARCTSRSFGHG